MFLYNSHFRLRWRFQGVSFNRALEEIRSNFKLVDNFVTEENVNSHCEYMFEPKKKESQLTNFNVYALETHNTDRARPYAISFYRLSKLGGKMLAN